MEHWGIYVAFAWLAVLVCSSAEAIYATRRAPQPQPLPVGATRPKEGAHT